MQRDAAGGGLRDDGDPALALEKRGLLLQVELLMRHAARRTRLDLGPPITCRDDARLASGQLGDIVHAKVRDEQIESIAGHLDLLQAAHQAVPDLLRL